jgi:hypothetical protein
VKKSVYSATLRRKFWNKENDKFNKKWNYIVVVI